MDTAPGHCGHGFYRVLLAEDCDSSRLAMEMCLRHAGCDPHGARNGRQALELFASASFDMVLMDLEMPDMDGHEVTACIRAMERERRLPPTPVIALTAHDDPVHRETCRQTGFTGYMVKPASTDTLRRLLETFCRPPAPRS
ncbi:MAG: response regulator [Desulfovibrionaceae bacterium]|nr:response regulator [Desulfovibrionaceae bacterium]